MPLLEEKVYTIDDIYALPEGERAELIDGHIYYTAPPNRTHQKISMELSARILEYIRPIRGNAKSMLLHLQYIWMTRLVLM